MTIEFYPLAVLYTRDLRPITVLKMTEFMHNRFLAYGMVRLAIYPEIKNYWEHENINKMTYQTIDIQSEIFVYRTTKSLMLFVDEECALLLQSEMLPGQIEQSKRDNKSAYKSGFAKGFLKAWEDANGKN
jgi:hypothetical protein